MKGIKRKQNENVNNYFDRKFKFVKDDTWKIGDYIYKDEKFTITKFQEKKAELNAVKEQLNKFDLPEWSRHTKCREPSTTIISTVKHSYKAELATQAWCKFYECLFEFPIISANMVDTGQVNSVHLCEAPGAFICALNHYLKTNYFDIKWDWIGNTLNPYYEGNDLMIPDDRLIRYTVEKWDFGLDLTGDLIKYYNHQVLVDKIKKKWKVHIVTADGSIDCMSNPGDQEKTVEFLHYCEVMTALQILDTGGSFVVKIFTMFEESTICLMYLLNCCFKNVYVFKPCTSKSGNSELYVICLHYTPLLDSLMSALMVPYITGKCEKSMFRLDQISSTFLDQIYDCGLFFMEKQMKVINENVKYFKRNDRIQQNYIRELTNKVVSQFEIKYNITILPNEFKIVSYRNINASVYYLAEYFLKRDDFTLCGKADISNIDISSILDIQIGKYILTINHSKFHTITNYSYNQETKSKQLHNLTQSVLLKYNNIVSFRDFEQFYGVSKFHRMFFREIFQQFTHEKNFLIVGVPLLTNFLVGLIFLISLCFQEICFFNNIIVLTNPDHSKVNVIREYLQTIHDTYLKIDKTTDVFTRDILHVVPVDFIYKKRFVNLICKYNDCILRYKY